MAATILVVDDEKNIRRTLRMVLEGSGFNTLEASSAEQCLETLETNEVDLLILDVRLPKMSGIEALEKIRNEPDTRKLPVLMVSGHASVAEAVQAVQLGATDFFEKPLDRERILVTVRNALQTWQLQREVEQLRADVEHRYEMIGESPAIRSLFAQLEKVAPTTGRVLISGESGTGKELIARAIHRLSPRADRSFVKVNCAAIPAELIESELFGYERGAFTGAQGRKKGMFELANGGTLFLDEIGDMSASAQAKVLRALQSGEISRVGGEKAIAVDVRVLAATNKALELEVKEGRFREDLYFRLNVVPIVSPPLRERKSDIVLLARAFLREFSLENGLREKPIDDDVLKALTGRPWPGNVRELRNVVERMAILSGDRITMDDLPEEGVLSEVRRESSPPSDLPASFDESGERLTLRAYRSRVEKNYILQTLDEVGWNISRAATILGVERTNLHKKMRSYGIRREEA
ncbi:MAG: sigma-54-dependent Fis family transcriptional regulator [Deltaproteobacteria bacterium]|nr:sigma-54-dependent Fis family transcriptional regulator [Deltaproteobacteria bacterium]MBW1873841.1 sigma-54-dependent Fis family transcriptional regulator [Deltaproteobacteria bacterium]MBW2209721.1 sigma-54-dependent Fis family transcriptional regulator [Deltaproteobacteria bacterium]MBW2213699.1 sigma-54-dependent Fis family transcriptional regulator [Deltaproteobacteria bacterium]MBW2378051.1 sigma-54-dependent Fis family transcriptional regulator [Deltaproteobacteria bacterium]